MPKPRTSETTAGNSVAIARAPASNCAPRVARGLRQVFVFERVERGERRRAGDLTSAEGRRVEQRRFAECAIPHRRSRDERADRNDAAGEPLGQRHHIGHDLLAVAGKAITAAPEARLHFIGHEERAGAVARLAYGSQITVGWNLYSAFALHRLDDERRSVGQRVEQRRGIAIGNRNRIREQRPEWRLKRFAAAHRERAERLAVIRVVRADDLRAAGCRARELDRALDRLRSAVAPKRDFEIAGGELRRAAATLARA